MTQWTSDQLDNVGRAEEVQIASLGSDGKLRKPVTVWVVRHGEDLYVRSVRGRSGHWFRGIQERHEGLIRAGRVQQEVTFVDADHGIDHEIERGQQIAERADVAGDELSRVGRPIDGNVCQGEVPVRRGDRAAVQEHHPDEKGPERLRQGRPPRDSSQSHGEHVSEPRVRGHDRPLGGTHVQDVGKEVTRKRPVAPATPVIQCRGVGHQTNPSAC